MPARDLGRSDWLRERYWRGMGEGKLASRFCFLCFPLPPSLFCFLPRITSKAHGFSLRAAANLTSPGRRRLWLARMHVVHVATASPSLRSRVQTRRAVGRGSRSAEAVCTRPLLFHAVRSPKRPGSTVHTWNRCTVYVSSTCGRYRRTGSIYICLSRRWFHGPNRSVVSASAKRLS